MEETARQAIESSERTLPTLRKTQEERDLVKRERDALMDELGRKTGEHTAEMQHQREEVERTRDQLRALKAQVLLLPPVHQIHFKASVVCRRKNRSRRSRGSVKRTGRRAVYWYLRQRVKCTSWTRLRTT